MDTEDELLLLAHGIVTFDTIVTGMEDLDTLGVTTPYRMEGQTRKHLLSFAMIWWSKVHGDPVWRDENLDTVLVEAKAWTIQHAIRLAELREGKVRRDR